MIITNTAKPTTALAEAALGLREMLHMILFPELVALDYGVEKLKEISEKKSNGFSGLGAIAILPYNLVTLQRLVDLPNPFEDGYSEQLNVGAEDPCKKFFLQKWNLAKGECELDLPMALLLGGAVFAVGMVIAK